MRLKTFPIHPLANRMPEMSPAEYAGLKESMAKGQIDPIVLLEGKVLDGRHRLKVCEELGLQPKTMDFDPAWGGPVDFVIAKVSHRNMSEGQKCWSAAMFHDDLMKLGNGGKSATPNGKSRDAVALRFGVSPRNLQNARLLMREAPSLFAKLGTDRTYNVNRAMQEHRRDAHQRDVRRAVRSAAADLSDCKLEHGDVVKRLEALPARTARLIFCDPPYNIGKRYHGDKHRDARKDSDFLAWCAAWLKECERVLTSDGSIFVMMNGLYAARVELILRGLGLHRRNTIYWWENNPENQTGNFSDAVRHIHYFTKSRTDFLFLDAVRVDSRRNQLGDSRGLDAGKIPDNVWIDCRIPGNSAERVPYADAPPQLPVAIPERCILVASERGDTVLDPFNGNGTTAIAALRNGRKYIGIDQSKKYLAQSEQWIRAALAASDKTTEAA